MKYYLLVDGQPSGPHTEEEVRLMGKTGSISGQALVWKEGLPEWLPIDQVIALDPPLPVYDQGVPVPAGLPAIPPEEKSLPPIPSRSAPSATRKVSGVIALALGVLTLLFVVGCVVSTRRLDQFETGTDPSDNARLLLNTAQGISQGDLFRGVQVHLDKHDELKETVSVFQVGAWLFAVAMVAAGGVFARSCAKTRAA